VNVIEGILLKNCNKRWYMIIVISFLVAYEGGIIVIRDE